MMLRIGSNRFSGSRVLGFSGLDTRTREHANTRTKFGFTLIEVMVTTAILSLGTVLIYEAFFISLNSYNYCSNYLNIVSLADEKIWQAQDSLSRLGSQAQVETKGKFINRNKNFTWELSYNSIEATQGLYRIDLILSWQQGPRKVKLLRTAYATYVEKK